MPHPSRSQPWLLWFSWNQGPHLLFPSPRLFLPPSPLPKPHSVTWPRLCVMWIPSNNQPVIPLWCPSVAVTQPGPGCLLPLAGLLSDYKITVTVSRSQPLLGQESCCHKKRVSFTQQPETKDRGWALPPWFFPQQGDRWVFRLGHHGLDGLEQGA